MCGFLGYFSQNEMAVSGGRDAVFDRALDLIAHRGPDQSMVVSGANWQMGFRRLSIQDLSEHAAQPMDFGNGQWLTFNGEIYNFHELRREFSTEGWRSTGDTEVLGRLLQRDGVEVTLRKLRGMFAFAWWDEKTGELTVARDAFGIKPLYYFQKADGALIVSSELRAIQFLCRAAMEPDTLAIAQYFRWGSVQSPRTIAKDIQTLMPGHILQWREGKVTTRRYFQPQWLGRETWWGDEKFAVSEVRNQVLDSVEAHLVSDVPVGVFLSGGLDSNIMCAAMKKLGVPKIHAFSIGYEGDTGIEDESDAASRSARFFDVDFHVERVSSQSVFEKFDHFIRHLNQPSGDALNVYLVSEVAARSVKVALSGLGADELFGGYNYYRFLLLAMRFQAWKFGSENVANALFRRLPVSLTTNRLVRALGYLSGINGRNVPELYAHARTILPETDVRSLLAGFGGASWQGTESEEWSQLQEKIFEMAPDSRLNQILLLEVQTYLTNTLLRDSDAMSMAHSLELRVPFVDLDIFKLSGWIPPHYKLRHGTGKWILREAFKELLPPWIYDDRKKKTFTLPIMHWLRFSPWKECVYDVLTSSACRNRGWFQPREVTRHLEQFYAQRDVGKRNFLFSQRVWLMFILESWAQCHLDAPTL